MWFVGYTPNLVGAVWIGYDRTDKEHQLQGESASATKLFKKILTKANVEHKEKFMKPEGVETIGAPIRLRKIEDVKMKLSFSPFGLFKAKLSRTPLPDNRIMYRIYRVENGIHTHVSTVNGAGNMRKSSLTYFQNRAFTLYHIIHKRIVKEKSQK